MGWKLEISIVKWYLNTEKSLLQLSEIGTIESRAYQWKKKNPYDSAYCSLGISVFIFYYKR